MINGLTLLYRFSVTLLPGTRQNLALPKGFILFMPFQINRIRKRDYYYRKREESGPALLSQPARGLAETFPKGCYKTGEAAIAYIECNTFNRQISV